MKNFVILIAFVSTTLLGLAISDSIKFSVNLNSQFSCDGILRSDDEFKESFFTLQEADLLVGKKVITKNSDFAEYEIGRIVSFEMIAPEKILIEVYWGSGAADENSRITFHDKENFFERLRGNGLSRSRQTFTNF